MTRKSNVQVKVKAKMRMKVKVKANLKSSNIVVAHISMQRMQHNLCMQKHDFKRRVDRALMAGGTRISMRKRRRPKRIQHAEMAHKAPVYLERIYLLAAPLLLLLLLL